LSGPGSGITRRHHCRFASPVSGAGDIRLAALQSRGRLR